MPLTPSDLLQRLHQRSPISPDTLAELEEVALHYPYFQIVHTLIAKAKHDQQAPDAEASLHRAAIYAPDRRHLRKIILEEIHQAPVAEATPEAFSTVEEPTVTANEPKPESAAVEDSEPDSIPEQSGIEQNESEPFAADEAVNQSDIEPTTTESVATDEPETGEEDQSVYEELEKNLKILQEKRSVPAAEEGHPLETTTATRDQQELIEKFVSHEHDTLTPASGREASAEDLSEKSTQAPEELVTENLAEIFIKQGKVEKGLALYEKLSLKFPEKKAYFADKIKQLKK